MRGRQLDHPTSVAGHEALRLLAAAIALFLAAATAQAAQPGIGERIALRIEDLPAPYASESVDNPGRFIERTARTTLDVADGFAVNYFAFGLENARWMTVAPNGDFFGWPYAYLGANPQPGYGHRRPDEVARTKLPDVLFRSHSAPLGLVFYDDSGFPAEYRGDAFVALHGSWNAASPRGYMIARVPFENGRPAGYYEVFATGFWQSGEKTALIWGRPAGLAVAADGSLLIADDIGGVIWRIGYQR